MFTTSDRSDDSSAVRIKRLLEALKWARTRLIDKETELVESLLARQGNSEALRKEVEARSAVIMAILDHIQEELRQQQQQGKPPGSLGREQRK